MYDDAESDFWKEQISQMQKKNLAHKNFNKLYISDCKQIFEDFKILHPELITETTFSASYSILEFFVTENVKFRLFVQNQTKGSFLQKQNGDLIKIADAKFPNNPFKEINEFLETRTELKKQLFKIKENAVVFQKKQKIVGEFIKSYLINLADEQFIWDLQPLKNDFLLKITKFDDKLKSKSYIITIDNFKQEIKSILKQISDFGETEINF